MNLLLRVFLSSHSRTAAEREVEWCLGYVWVFHPSALWLTQWTTFSRYKQCETNWRKIRTIKRTVKVLLNKKKMDHSMKRIVRSGDAATKKNALTKTWENKNRWLIICKKLLIYCFRISGIFSFKYIAWNNAYIVDSTLCFCFSLHFYIAKNTFHSFRCQFFFRTNSVRIFIYKFYICKYILISRFIWFNCTLYLTICAKVSFLKRKNIGVIFGHLSITIRTSFSYIL